MTHQIGTSRTRYTELHVVRHDDDEETACGIGRCKPRGLQALATIGWFTTCNGFAYVMTSCIASFISSQLTTLERQFGFSSRQTGTILAASNVSYIACVLFISYLGNHLHIPKSLCIGTFMFGVCGIICSLPHFMFGSQLNSDLSVAAINSSHAAGAGSEPDRGHSLYGQLCDPSVTPRDKCDVTGADNSGQSQQGQNSNVIVISLVVLVVGMLVQGLGKGPRFSFAVTYVDNNTDPQNTGFYTGIMITCSVLGPVVSFLAGAIFNQIHVTLRETQLDPKHPSWIGAWWLGYLLLGLVTVLASLPLRLFPRHLPTAHHKLRPHPPQTVGRQEETREKSRTQQAVTFIKDFLSCQVRLWTNPVFTLINLCSTCIVFSISSQSFIAKYLEKQFDLPAHQANYTMAVRSLVATSLGTFLGGYLSHRLRMSAFQALKFITLMLLLSCVLTSAGFFLFCKQPAILHLAGTHPDCSGDCRCSDNSFFPICGGGAPRGVGGNTYYSPCQAGCRHVAQSQTGYLYSSCACIPGGTAVSGACPYGCPYLYLYVIFSALTSFCQTLTIIPRVIIFIRCVGNRDKSAAMGLQSFTNSFLGYLSGGLIFGSLIDGVCTVWDVNCDLTGHCLHYDNDRFRVKLHQYMLVPLVMASVCGILAYVYCLRTGSLQQPEEELEREEKQS